MIVAALARTMQAVPDHRGVNPTEKGCTIRAIIVVMLMFHLLPITGQVNPPEMGSLTNFFTTWCII